MSPRRGPLVAAGVLLAVLFAAPADLAAAAAPRPFGHLCVPQRTVRLCPTNSLEARVPSFDGTPLDVDVTLPRTGDGPFPTIVMLHEFGGDKDRFLGKSAESLDRKGQRHLLYHYNDVYYAQRGYAVVRYSARGFGRSCGTQESRTAECSGGWMHLADQRWEARDTQYLLGRLVDAGVAKADALAVTGASYGGAQAMQLALLRDRIRLADGSFEPWKSPAGTPLRIAAAYARHGYTDLTDTLFSNGRFLDYRPASGGGRRGPLGVPVQPVVAGFLETARQGFAAPRGLDRSADVETWTERLLAGDHFGRDVKRFAAELAHFHGVSGLSARPAPLLVESGWTDSVVPARQALMLYSRLRDEHPDAPISLQLGDLGHAPGTNSSHATFAFSDRASAFFDSHLKGEGRAPSPGGVAAYLLTCPDRTARSKAIYSRSWRTLARGAIVLRGRGSARIRQRGRPRGTPLPPADPIAPAGCGAAKPGSVRRGTAVFQWRLGRATLLGRPTVRARVRGNASGRRLVALLFDIDRKGRARQISQTVYRLGSGRNLEFQLDAIGYRLARGHTLALALSGSLPGFVAASDRSLSIRVSRLSLELPVREGPNGRSIRRPRRAR